MAQSVLSNVYKFYGTYVAVVLQLILQADNQFHYGALRDCLFQYNQGSKIAMK